MPIIASQHARDPWRPLLQWPDDCTVQWGRSGLVLREVARGGCYETAFFEAFPVPAGFIRGEGQDLEAAEKAAYARWKTHEGCVSHVYGRRGYLNGVGCCVKCGHLKSKAFKPVVDLDGWKKPLKDIEIQCVTMGLTADREDDDEDSRKHHRRMHLRFKVAGVPLPDPPAGPLSWKAQMAHGEACYEVLIRYALEHADRIMLDEPKHGSMMERLLSGRGFRGVLEAAKKRVWESCKTADEKALARDSDTA